MEEILYVIDDATDELALASDFKAMKAAFDDFGIDSAHVAAIVDGAVVFEGVEGEAPCGVFGAVHTAFGADARCVAFVDGATLLDGASDCEIPDGAHAIVVDAGDMAVLSMDRIGELAQRVVERASLSAIGRIVVLWSGSDAERMGQELFVMGRLAAVRIAFAEAIGGRTQEAPLLYFGSDGDAKRACALVAEGLFDGVVCAKSSWSPMKLASLAARLAEGC